MKRSSRFSVLAGSADAPVSRALWNARSQGAEGPSEERGASVSRIGRRRSISSSPRRDRDGAESRVSDRVVTAADVPARLALPQMGPEHLGS